ncbi:hypothetical protein diail_4681 [Diaporthe ilicicola]|nr:hypothetical protein diail_4681 [Diaporthe ilicicola]
MGQTFGSYSNNAHGVVFKVLQSKQKAGIPDPLVSFNPLSPADFDESSEGNVNGTKYVENAAILAGPSANAATLSNEILPTTRITCGQGLDMHEDKDGMVESDTTCAINAVTSSMFGSTDGKTVRGGVLSRFGDAKGMISKSPKPTAQEYLHVWTVQNGEVTPEIGRGNERRLSEDDNGSSFPGPPVSGDDPSSRPWAGNTASSDLQLRPGNRALARPQLPQSTSPAQAPLGNSQPFPPQPFPPQPFPPQPFSPQPFSRQPMPYPPPRNTSVPVSQGTNMGFAPPWPGFVQPTQQRGTVRPFDYGGFQPRPRTPMSGVGQNTGPPRAPSITQTPQNSFQGPLQSEAAAYGRGQMGWGNTSDRLTAASINSAPASPFPFTNASLPSAHPQVQRQEGDWLARGDELRTRHQLPDGDGHVPEYLLDQFMGILNVSGEQEAVRFLQESKARAGQNNQNSRQSQRKRSNTTAQESDEGPSMLKPRLLPPSKSPARGMAWAHSRGRAWSPDDVFDPLEDDPSGGALAFGTIPGLEGVIDDDPASFGISEIRNARGEIMVAPPSRRSAQSTDNNSPALNARVIDIHIEDDLVGAAESATPVAKFRRLMSSSPHKRSPTKKG